MSGATSTSLITSPSIRPEKRALTRSASFQTVSFRLICLNVRPDQSSNPAGTPENANGPPRVGAGRRRSCRLGLGLGRAAGLRDQPRDDVRVAVGVRAAVLEVAGAVLLDLPRDAHRRTAVRHAVGELVPR